MPDFLTRRNGVWHFVRCVPLEFSAFDKRGIVRHSTKVRVSSDRTGRRAVCVAERLNEKLEAFWAQCVRAADPTAASYDEVRSEPVLWALNTLRILSFELWQLKSG